MSDYLQELNEEQRAAVLYNDGPQLVIAGAGSGKTRVLTYKIAYLLENGYQPWNILALTFTNKAAREMKSRIARQVGEERARKLWMGTFHAIFLRILHAEAGLLGFTPQFTVYDTADTKSLQRTIIKDLKLDEKVYKPGMVQSFISNAKNHLILPANYANDAEISRRDKAAQVPAMSEIYHRYMERCRQADAMDFDDLLVYTYLLFRDHPDRLAHYREMFRYVLVDEYQDTNYVQHSIVLQLTREHRHVCVVGDDAQSIYSFRGANIDNILSFTQAYEGARIFKLEQNYRSTQTIVRAANSLIQKNRMQIQKEVFSKNEEGDAIGVFQAYSDADEAEIVTNKITELRRKEHSDYADFAILYRTNAQSRIFEETLRKRGMPYRIYGGLSFYQRKEIKDAIAYFRLTVNPNDEEALKRIINYPGRGIGDTTVGKITAAAGEHNVSLWTVLCAPDTYGVKFNKGTLNKLQDFRTLMEGFIKQAQTDNAYQLGLAIIKDSGIAQDINRDNTTEGLSRRANIEELINGMSDFCTQRLEEGNEFIGLGNYLSEVSLLTDQDSDDPTDDEKITLMTIHSAKGLEFKTVFVVGMEEGLFPNTTLVDTPRAVEEERRLFYVAITRAEEHCFLSYAKTRMRYGSMTTSSPSRFLYDINPSYLKLPNRSALKASIDQKSQDIRQETRMRSASLFTAETQPAPHPQPTVTSPRRLSPLSSAGKPARPTPPANTAPVHAGQHIEHERFGQGEIVKVEGEGDNVKATIRFRNAGEKQLLLRFARFKVID